MATTDKSRIEATQNETFTIELISNPSTGYNWKWINEKSCSLVKKIENSFVSDHPDRVGSGGKEIWTFKAINSGTDTLKFEYNRAWEPDSTIEKKEFIVHVK